jgi:hypothetical protein
MAGRGYRHRRIRLSEASGDRRHHHNFDLIDVRHVAAIREAASICRLRRTRTDDHILLEKKLLGS